jgi:hypothetical protein
VITDALMENLTLGDTSKKGRFKLISEREHLGFYGGGSRGGPNTVKHAYNGTTRDRIFAAAARFPLIQLFKLN